MAPDSKIHGPSVCVHLDLTAEELYPLIVAEVCSWLTHQHSDDMLSGVVQLLPSSDVFEMHGSEMIGVSPRILLMDQNRTDSGCG